MSCVAVARSFCNCNMGFCAQVLTHRCCPFRLQSTSSCYVQLSSARRPRSSRITAGSMQMPTSPIRIPAECRVTGGACAVDNEQILG
jgi:hypothetical protein